MAKLLLVSVLLFGLCADVVAEQCQLPGVNCCQIGIDEDCVDTNPCEGSFQEVCVIDENVSIAVTSSCEFSDRCVVFQTASSLALGPGVTLEFINSEIVNRSEFTHQNKIELFGDENLSATLNFRNTSVNRNRFQHELAIMAPGLTNGSEVNLEDTDLSLAEVFLQGRSRLTVGESSKIQELTIQSDQPVNGPYVGFGALAEVVDQFAIDIFDRTSSFSDIRNGPDTWLTFRCPGPGCTNTPYTIELTDTMVNTFRFMTRASVSPAATNLTNVGPSTLNFDTPGDCNPPPLTDLPIGPHVTDKQIFIDCRNRGITLSATLGGEEGVHVLSYTFTPTSRVEMVKTDKTKAYGPLREALGQSIESCTVLADDDITISDPNTIVGELNAAGGARVRIDSGTKVEAAILSADQNSLVLVDEGDFSVVPPNGSFIAKEWPTLCFPAPNTPQIVVANCVSPIPVYPDDPVRAVAEGPGSAIWFIDGDTPDRVCGRPGAIVCRNGGLICATCTEEDANADPPRCDKENIGQLVDVCGPSSWPLCPRTPPDFKP